MKGEIADIVSQAECNRMKLAHFDAAACRFFQGSDDLAANPLLKRVSADIPAQQSNRNQAEHRKQQEQLPPFAPGTRRPIQRFCSPSSGFEILLSERKLCSQPAINSFIFCSASRSLIRFDTSGSDTS